MTKQVLRYFYFHEPSSVIYHSEKESDRTDLIFLGQTENPDIGMAAEAFIGKKYIKQQYVIRPL